MWAVEIYKQGNDGCPRLPERFEFHHMMSPRIYVGSHIIKTERYQYISRSNNTLIYPSYIESVPLSFFCASFFLHCKPKTLSGFNEESVVLFQHSDFQTIRGGGQEMTLSLGEFMYGSMRAYTTVGVRNWKNASVYLWLKHVPVQMLGTVY